MDKKVVRQISEAAKEQAARLEERRDQVRDSIRKGEYPAPPADASSLWRAADDLEWLYGQYERRAVEDGYGISTWQWHVFVRSQRLRALAVAIEAEHGKAEITYGPFA